MVSAIARDLAHSWSGDLVGNATWRDWWLDAGISAYFEGRLVSALYGEPRASMEAVLGLQALRADLAKLEPKDQVLAIDLRDRDPKLAFSAVPREKGRLFMNYLDAKFGRDRFDAFLLGYADHFALKSVTTEQFTQYLSENLLDRFPGIVSRDKVLAWEKAPGIPTDAVLPVTNAFDTVDYARNDWLAGKLQAKTFGLDWIAPQWCYFLDNMPAVLPTKQLDDLDKAYRFTRSENAEVTQCWLGLAISNRYQPAYARLEDYLKTVGR